MPEQTENEPVQSGGEGDLGTQSMNILSSLHAAMVNFHLYPPTSDLVKDSVKRALDDLLQGLASWGSITFCELEGKLLINEFCLEERDQSRPNTQAFLKDLGLWEVRSITFDSGLEDEELWIFLELFGRKRADRTIEGSLGGLLQADQIGHIKVDEKIYVSLSKDQDLSSLGGEFGGEAMDLLKDEVFVRYLIGNMPALDASAEEVSELMSDRQRINTAFNNVMFGFESSGGAVGPEKARVIRDTVDKMYGLVEKLPESDLKDTLSDEMVNILATLEPETLVEVLTETAPEAVKSQDMRRDIISSIEGENVLKLADQIIEKYRKLLDERDRMKPQDYEDLCQLLNEIIADLYEQGDPSYHPEITSRLRESGLLDQLARRHPEAGRDMELFAIVTDIQASGSLRPLEGLSDPEVIQVARKLLDLGDNAIPRKIIATTMHNLESDRVDFRLRAASFLKQMHVSFRQSGHAAEVLEKAGELLELLRKEQVAEVKQSLVELSGIALADLFAKGKLEEFRDLGRELATMAESDDDQRIRWGAREALSLLDPESVGKPLAEALFGDDQEMKETAGEILPFIADSIGASEIVEKIKGEEEIKIGPELAMICRSMGDKLVAGIHEIMDSNAREEVYVRSLQILEAVGGNAALGEVKSAQNNPIPAVRAQAYRSMTRMAPGDPTLLPHFLKALSDEEVEVRREAARGLGTIDDPRSIEALLGIVNGKSASGGEENPRVEEAACMALAHLGPEKALAPISDLLRKKTFGLRRRSIHPRVQAAACFALSQLGGPESVEVVRGHLDDSDPIVRNEARKAMGVFRKQGYVD
jgi:acyl carrier protein